MGRLAATGYPETPVKTEAFRDASAGARRILGAIHVPSTFLFLVELLMEMKPFEQELGGGGHQAWALERTEREDAFAEARNGSDAIAIFLRGHRVGHLHSPTLLEIFDRLFEIVDFHVLVE